MYMSEHLHQGDRVRIRKDVDPSLYHGMLTIGNEGIIRQVREDRFGLPQVWIEWDKNHWTYNGAPDGWTFEEHFDIINTENKKDNMSSDKANKQALAAKFAKLFTELFDDESDASGARVEDVPTVGTSEDLRAELETSDSISDRTAIIAAVHEILSEAEAFMVIGVQRMDHPKSQKGMMVPFALSYADNFVAELLTAVHMSSLTTQSYQELALRAIETSSDNVD
jgi:hypothetical protein